MYFVDDCYLSSVISNIFESQRSTPEKFLTLPSNLGKIGLEISVMHINFDYIINIASNNEGVDVEFKETTGQLNRGMETLCGMINGRGGIVVFGINNKGNILGQYISDKTTREVGEALRKFDPSIDIQPQYIRVPDSDKELIVFCSNGMESDKPYMWDGKPYQRHDSVTTVMPREKFLRMYEAQTGLTYKWERKVNSNLTVDSLDNDLIHRVVDGGIRRGRLSEEAKGDDTSSILKRLKLAQNGMIRNSAAILFGKDLTDYPQMLLRLARFKGVDKTEFIDNRQIFGNVFELARAAMDFFFKHLSLAGSTHNRIEREDGLEIPYDALREAVVNALCHRAWQQEASSIGIAIFDNRIEIENAGRFPATLSPQRMVNDETSREENISLPPNPDIANVMFIGGLIEHWGRGLAMMNKECVKVGLPLPQFFDNGYMVKVTFIRPGHTGIRTVREQLENSDRTVEEHLKSISSPLRRLLITIGENLMSGQELRAKMGYRSKGSFWTNYLSPAIEKGLVLLENEESPKSPNQRYGLTEFGRRIFKAIEKEEM